MADIPKSSAIKTVRSDDSPPLSCSFVELDHRPLPLASDPHRFDVQDDRETLGKLSALSISNEEVLNDISSIVDRIRNNLDISAVENTIDGGYTATKTIHECPQYESPKTTLHQNTPFQSLLIRLKVELFGTQEFILECLQNRQRLHAELLKKTSTKTFPRATQKTTAQDTLPVELWAQIFFLCLPDEQFVKPDPQRAPWMLCQVCRTWRTIATGTPLLWSTLSIRGSWRRYIGRPTLECWLSRSCNASLCLEISIPAHMENPFDPDAMELITSTAHRWRHLRLCLPDNLLRYLLDNHMPVLHRLEFSSTYPIDTLTIQASQAPDLRVVSLLTRPLYPQPLSLPWQQLESISSQCWLNMGQHLEILRMCPRLRFYSMCLVHADIPPDSKPLLMHHLRHLEIIAFVGNAMGPILSLLQLPKLTQLSFMVPEESPVCGIADWPKFQVISLVERSSCVLTKLTLKGVNMSSVTDLIEYIPTIVTLDIL